jgi:predicted O-linked N-acetylglucosamine transferase (SPINDLY family)
MNDQEVAQMLRDQEIDIAIDLTGFTTDCRPGILARRAAPIQVNYLGYPGTMGADYIDYILADRFVIPEEQQVDYAEKVVYLPDTFQPERLDSKDSRAHAVAGRSRGCRSEDSCFCSFNNSYKITPAVFDVWMRVLGQVEGSVLWLLGGNVSLEANLRREAERRAIESRSIDFWTMARL